MSVAINLLKAGSLLALGNLASRVTADDVNRITGISGRQLRRYGIRRGDALLGRVGLVRKRRVLSKSFIILGVTAASAVLGAGAMFLLGAEAARRFRIKMTGPSESSAQDKGRGAETSFPGNGEPAMA